MIPLQSHLVYVIRGGIIPNRPALSTQTCLSKTAIRIMDFDSKPLSVALPHGNCLNKSVERKQQNRRRFQNDPAGTGWESDAQLTKESSVNR
jgi:hypothetical protein